EPEEHFAHNFSFVGLWSYIWRCIYKEVLPNRRVGTTRKSARPSAGLMVISQLVPFARSQGISSDLLATMTLVVAACGNAGGRILSGWFSDSLGRLNVLRLMIGIS